MALVKRLQRLLAADMHALVDRLEAPEPVLRQALREMEAGIAEEVLQVQAIAAELDAGRARIESLTTTRRELDSKLDLCFERRDEALARRLIRRKLRVAREIEQLERERAGLEDRLAEHETRVASRRAELERVRREAEALDLAAGTVAAGDAQCESAAIDDDDVEIALLSEKQARGIS